MKNKIILLNLNAKKTLYGNTINFSAIQPNVVIGLLSSYLKSKGIDVEVIDETRNFSIPDYCEYIRKENPVLVGVVSLGANPSSSTMSMVGVIKFFKEYNKNKAKGTKTCVIGGHPSVLPERSLKETEADFIIIGEGYQTLNTLYTAIKRNKDTNFVGVYSKEYPNTLFPELVNLNTLPMVDWSEMNPNKYRAHTWHTFGDINNRSPYGIIYTSFGCPYGCYYCCINNLFGKRTYRTRDMKSVVDEIGILVNKYKVKHIKIMDELFITKGKRIDEFCDLLEEKNYDINMWSYGRVDTVTPRILKRLKKVGMNWISYGFESQSQSILDSVSKGCVQNYDEVIKWTRDAGMNICADFIAGLWEDDYNTLQATYDFACKHNFEWLNVYPCFAYPGTPMYEQYLKEGKIKEPKDWSEYALYGYDCIPLHSKYLTSKEVLEWRDKHFTFYMSRPEYLEMIFYKFGKDTVDHILDMVKNPLKRKILE